jgi:glycosyltransferase 2 family protein
VRKWLLLVAKVAVFALIVWFIRDTLLKAWEQIHQEEWHVSPGWLIAAGALYAASMLPSAWFWSRALRAMGQDVRLGEAVRAFCVGSLGKYVPGKAMVVVIRSAMVRSERVLAGVAAAGVFFETLTLMAVGALLSIGVLGVRLANGSLALDARLNPHVLLWGTAAMMIVAGLPTVPPVFRRLAALARVTRSDPTTAEKLRGLGFATLGLGWAAQTLAWLLMAASLWATFRAVGLDQPAFFQALPDYVAAVALATVAGFLAMIPAGLGVRDVLLVSLLVILLAADPGRALVIAGLMRIIWLVAEVVVSTMLYFI